MMCGYIVLCNLTCGRSWLTMSCARGETSKASPVHARLLARHHHRFGILGDSNSRIASVSFIPVFFPTPRPQCSPCDTLPRRGDRLRIDPSMRSSSNRRPHGSGSLSPSESSPKFTPSPRSSHSSDGPSMLHEPNSFELRTIRPQDEPVAKGGDEEDDGLLPSIRRPSTDSAQSYELYTPDEDRAVLKKLDRRLVAFMALLYMLSFLDRSSE